MRLRRAFTAALLSGALVVVAATAAQADPASDFVSRANQLRASKGVAALAVNSQLASIAQQWAAHMAATHTLSHNPNLANQAPSNWTKLGENVGEGPDVNTIENAFEHSPEHYANLVDPSFQYIGVGVVVDSSGVMWVAEDFMQTSSPPPSPPPPPPPPPPTSPPAPPPAPPAPSPTAAPAPRTTPAPTAPPTTATATTTTTTPAADLPLVVSALRRLNANS